MCNRSTIKLAESEQIRLVAIVAGTVEACSAHGISTKTMR